MPRKNTLNEDIIIAVIKQWRFENNIRTRITVSTLLEEEELAAVWVGDKGIEDQSMIVALNKDLTISIIYLEWVEITNMNDPNWVTALKDRLTLDYTEIIRARNKKHDKLPT